MTLHEDRINRCEAVTRLKLNYQDIAQRGLDGVCVPMGAPTIVVLGKVDALQTSVTHSSVHGTGFA